MLEIPEVTDIDVALGANPPLPKWDDIPAEFKAHPGTSFNKIVSTIFFEGGRLSDFGLTPKDGVDASKAYRALVACLGSFEPKHEHKESGCAYMLSEWFNLEAKP